MSAISVSSQSIADITHVIESIAFPDQYPGTEHAGEYGKGFTVVAAEVQALAQRSAGSKRDRRPDLVEISISKIPEGHELSEQTASELSQKGRHLNQLVSVFTRKG